MIFKKTSFFLIIIGLSVILSSWGYRGHQKISGSINLFFNQQMTQFLPWVSFITDHASDADYRKSTDPTESYKHYIDLEIFPDFEIYGNIEQDYETACNSYGISVINDAGILPWATLASFDSLKNCLMRMDINKAKIFAADLGHYVADGHMPLHLTVNYNGQLTGNYGIHSRYESTMINSFISQIQYSGKTIEEIEDVNQYIFNYIYANYIYKDSVLASDNYAKSINTNYSSQQYKNALWNHSKNYTIKLFQDASYALTELIYTAWIQAGMPNIEGFGVESYTETKIGEPIPNPANDFFKIPIKVPNKKLLSVQLFTIAGNIVYSESKVIDNFTDFITIYKKDLKSGVYFVNIKIGNDTYKKKIIFI